MVLVNLKKLVALLSLSSLDGHVVSLAGSNLLILPMAPVFAFTLLAGPSAIMTAATLDGSLKEKILTSVAAGLIATFIIVIAAILGTKRATIINFQLLKLAGATAVLSIALLLFGATIPEKTPLIVMIVGVIASVVWR